MEGTILKIIENKYLSYTFGKKEPESDEDVIVEVTFTTDSKTRTIINLYQKDIADSEYGYVTYNLSCMLGWSYFLMNLRSVFESGYDLREKTQQLAFKAQAYTLER